MLEVGGDLMKNKTLMEFWRCRQNPVRLAVELVEREPGHDHHHDHDDLHDHWLSSWYYNQNSHHHIHYWLIAWFVFFIFYVWKPGQSLCRPYSFLIFLCSAGSGFSMVFKMERMVMKGMMMITCRKRWRILSESSSLKFSLIFTHCGEYLFKILIQCNGFLSSSYPSANSLDK